MQTPFLLYQKLQIYRILIYYIILLLDFDKNSATGLVFIDYKEASDLIVHGFLPTKLNEDADST